MSEADLLAAVIALARVLGWRVAHFRTALTGRGWKTAVAGDGAGFPDLLLVGHGRIIAAELKSDIGKVTPEQWKWLCAFGQNGVGAHVWRPDDWRDGTIALVLGALGARAA